MYLSYILLFLAISSCSASILASSTCGGTINQGDADAARAVLPSKKEPVNRRRLSRNYNPNKELIGLKIADFATASTKALGPSHFNPLADGRIKRAKQLFV